jgi:hypothetical protein
MRILPTLWVMVSCSSCDGRVIMYNRADFQYWLNCMSPDWMQNVSGALGKS